MHRILGGKVLVKGAPGLAGKTWATEKVEGMRILGPYTFELLFEREIKNLAGVEREALSTNSRLNRVWPVRLTPTHSTADKAKDLPEFDLVSKFPVRKINNTYVLNGHGYNVTLVTRKDCSGSDF